MTATVPVRVTVLPVWDDVPLELPGSATVAEVKRRALEAARAKGAPEEFTVKFRGIELRDESASLEAAGIPSGAALVVLRRRRVAVR